MRERERDRARTTIWVRPQELAVASIPVAFDFDYQGFCWPINGNGRHRPVWLVGGFAPHIIDYGSILNVGTQESNFL